MRDNNSILGVAGWQKNSFIDFPGTVCTVLFFSGCNLACPYCHNPEIVRGTIKQQIPSETIWDFLRKRKGTIDGVVFSGGEPTLHSCLTAVSKEIIKMGYKIKLDTNGMLPEMVRKISFNYIALDVKTSPNLYKDLLKSPYHDSEKRLFESINIVKEMGENAEIRITVAPKIINKNIICEIGKIIKGVKKVFLQPMQNKKELLDSNFMKLNPHTIEEIKEFQKILSYYVEQCIVRGE
jgi:pyruvate formate lyase activating enzyme